MRCDLLAAVGLPFAIVCIASIALRHDRGEVLDRSHYWFENVGFAPREPFSTLTNLCHIFSATWLTTHATPKRAVSFGIVAFSLTMVGATSFLFHFDGARTRTAFHFGDLVAIVTFGFLLSAFSLLELLTAATPPSMRRVHEAIELVRVVVPLSSAFAGHVLFSGWEVYTSTFFSNGLFLILGIVTSLLKRQVFAFWRAPKIDRRALLLVVLDYGMPLVAMGTAYVLNKDTWDLRRDAYEIDYPDDRTCTPAGYEFYRPYLGGCCDGLEERQERTPDDHYGNCGGGRVVYGCHPTIVVCREPDFVYTDEAVYEQGFFVRKYYETYDVSHGVWHLLCAIFLGKVSFLVLADNDDGDVREKALCLLLVGVFCGAAYPTCITYDVEYDGKVTMLLFGSLSLLVFPSFAGSFLRLAKAAYAKRRCGLCEKEEDDASLSF